MAFEEARRVDRQRAVVDRRAVGNDHQDAAVLGAAQQAVVRPHQRLAVDVFLEQPLAHHQAEIAARAAPRLVGLFVEDVAQIVEASGVRGAPVGEPHLAALPALPRAGGEAEDLGLHAAAFERAREDIGADRGDRDRPPAHAARIVDQQRNDRVLELGIAFDLVAERMAGADHHAGQPRGIEHAFFLVEVPAAVLLRHEPTLQPVGQPRDHALQARQLAVEIGAQPVELFIVAQLGGFDLLVEFLGIGLVVEAFGKVGPRAIGADGLHAFLAIVRRIAIGHFLFALDVLVGVALGLAIGDFRTGIGGIGFGPALVFLVGFVLVLGVLALLVLAILGIGRFGGFGQRQVEIAQDVERQVLEGALVVEHIGQPVHVGADLGKDILAHQINPRAGAFGHRFAGQRLAQHQRQRGGQRDIARRRGAYDRIGRGAHLDRRVEIAANARIARGADRFVADLFDRVVTGARDRFGRRALAMQRFAVMP